MSGRIAESDAGWNWPDWVPAKVRAEIESFYVHHGGPEGWRARARQEGAPKLGRIVTLGNGFGPCPQPVTGRFVFAWNNIARLVLDDGSYRYTSFHSRFVDGELTWRQEFETRVTPEVTP